MRRRYYLPLISIILFILSCSEDDSPIVNVEYEKLSLNSVCNIASIARSDVITKNTYVITNQQHYEKLTSCISNPIEVDFSKNFVLAGRVAFDNCAELKSESIQLKDNILQYQINIEQQDCEKLDTIYFMASVPVRFKDNQVSFDINY